MRNHSAAPIYFLRTKISSCDLYLTQQRQLLSLLTDFQAEVLSDTFFLPKAQNEHLATTTTQLSGVSTKARSKLFRTPTLSRLIHGSW
jgi:hypothetical protein